jgi:cytoskeletal protein CcmA (bactofilin family)
MFAKVKERIEAGTRPGNAASSNSGGGNGGAEKKAVPSIISRDMVVNGNLDTPGEVHVEGTIRGDVSCAKLIIGASGSVEGHIFAHAVRIHGNVQGEINADEVFLLNGSSVSGDVVQNMLEIAPGAAFEGAVRRRGTAASPRMLAAPVADKPDETADAPAVAEAAPPDIALPETGEAEKGDGAAPESAPLELTDSAPTEIEAPVPEIPADETAPSSSAKGKARTSD